MLIDFGLVVGKKRFILVMKLLSQFVDLGAMEIGLFVESLLKHLVLFGPFVMLIPLSFKLLVGLFEFLHVSFSQFILLFLTLLLLSTHFALH